jgi:hypothetical protein
MSGTRNGDATLQHQIGARGEFALRIHTGDADIRATDGDAVTVRDVDGRDLDEQFVIERGPGRLAIWPRDRVMLDLGFLRKGRGAANLVVELPREASVTIDSASGEIRADGLVGDQRYRTASGDISLSGVAGVLGVDGVSGSVRIDAGGATELSGRLVSGDLRLRGGVLKTLAFATTSGDVALLAPLDGGGPFSIQTVSGDVQVVAGPGGVRVDAHTVTGEVLSDASRASKTRRDSAALVIGEGRALLSFKSISGDLRVASAPASGEVASHASPEPPAPVAPPRPPQPPPAAGSPEAPDADPRLAILRELEAGVIDVDTATARLAVLEDGTDA